MDKVTKIALVFHDNDFHRTFRSVLKVLGIALRDGMELDKTKILNAVNGMGYDCYLLFQNDWETAEQLAKDKDHMIEYLTLEEKDILINYEVDKYKEETDWNNGETWILEYNEHIDDITIYSW